MAGAWKGGMALSNATSIGAVTSGTSSGTVLNASASTFTKGAYSQLIASTTADIDWLLVAGETMTTGGSTFAVDLAVGGAGSELVVVSNLNFSVAGGSAFFLPLTIPAATRVAARVASNNANDTFRIIATGFEDTYQSAATSSSFDTYGFSTSTNLGTLIDPGATPNTKSGYTTISASTTNDYSGFLITLDTQNTIGGTVGIIQWLVDIAIGAAGSEVVILPNLFEIGFSSAANLTPLYIQASQHYFPIQVPAGTRISARSQCTTGTSPDRLIGVTIYGVRL